LNHRREQRSRFFIALGDFNAGSGSEVRESEQPRGATLNHVDARQQTRRPRTAGCFTKSTRAVFRLFRLTFD
jgi:hypothetical protein